MYVPTYNKLIIQYNINIFIFVENNMAICWVFLYIVNDFGFSKFKHHVTGGKKHYYEFFSGIFIYI